MQDLLMGLVRVKETDAFGNGSANACDMDGRTMIGPTNPYIAGNPVGGSPAFVGRETILRSVLRMLENPGENAIVLYGQRRIGKTSVLQELVQRLRSGGPYHPLYFDLRQGRPATGAGR